MQKSLKLVFLDTQGDKQSVFLPEVKSDITSEEIRSLTDVVLRSNVFGDEIRSFDKPVEAVLTSKEVDTITF